jgi:hypothetical protein
MGNDETSFAVVIGGSGDGSIQSAQGRRRSIAARGRGCDGPDQSNNNDRRLQMGGGTTRTASRSRKATRVSGGGTGTMIESDRDATRQRLR